MSVADPAGSWAGQRALGVGIAVRRWQEGRIWNRGRPAGLPVCEVMRDGELSLLSDAVANLSCGED